MKQGSFKRLGLLLRRLHRQEQGVAAVEFALTLPIYLGALIFLIEMARIAYTQGVILHAAEEATRYALVHYDATASDLQDKARENLLGLDPANLTAIIVTAPVDPADQTKLVTVEVQYQFVPILPLNQIMSLGKTEGFALTGASKGFLTEEIPAS